MNLFVAAQPGAAADVERLRAEVARLAAELPALDGGTVWDWTAPSGRATAHGVSHPQDRLGGATHVARDATRFATFAGRPVLWDDETADGAAPLDASLYLGDAGGWAERLDGRFAVLRYDDEAGTLTVVTDPVGSYPVYRATGRGGAYVSNSAELLRRLIGSSAQRPEVIATFGGCGWSLGGTPLWDGVDRLARARVHTFDGGEPRSRELLPVAELGSASGGAFDRERAARLLRSLVRAQAGWEGRPLALPLTGGRDSRVIFAAALTAEVKFEAETSALPHLPGYPDTADVVIARQLCETVGMPHQVNTAKGAEFDVLDALRVLRLASPGTLSLGGISAGTVTTFTAPDQRDAPPLRLLLSGANGEVARTYYGLGTGLDAAALVSRFEGRLVPVYPRPILNDDGRAIVHDHIAGWVDEVLGAGVAATVAPDLFYLLERMSNWAGPLHGMSEYSTDVVAPLWHARIVQEQLSLEPGERSAAAFHSLVLETLAPELARIPYEGATYGVGRTAQVAKRVKQARAELARRLGPLGDRTDDPLVRAHGQLREQVLGGPAGGALWAVFDRRRVEGLFKRDPRRLDPRSRDLVWRLATLAL